MLEADHLTMPRVGDPVQAERGLARWARAAEGRPAAVAAFVAAGAAAPVLGPVLPGLFGGSPFLAECLLAEPEFAHELTEDGPEPTAGRLLEKVGAIAHDDRHRLMAQLRLARRRAALLAGLADLAGLWPLERVSAFLSTFADRCIEQCVRHLLLEGVRRGDIAPEAAEPARSGLIVLGMGKLGALELNYSSDVDLIVLFDQQSLPYRGAETPMAFATRLTRSLVHILEHRTREGYVFRTDLRLRPHLPGHPLAISTEAAELYYERHGQNWERAAFIKARQVAGDPAAGASFLATLRPYVWRRHLDFAAIRDIHSIKRQINAHRGFATIQLLGHDLKVGRGGIREIEFFAQVQQLILGGREPELRAPGTQEALRALAAHRWVDERTTAELTAAYRFLRVLEHRLQMIADKQTQALPQQPDEFARFAAFAGGSEPEKLGQAILQALRTVERHYAALFETEPDLGLRGSLVFTGTSDHAETLETLQRIGFSDPAAVAARIRAWHHGHIRATRSTRARELLTELLPTILDALHRQARIDEAFRLFDQFISSLPAGVQVFSLFRANAKLLGLLSDLFGAAPRLAPHLARHSDLFEAMLQPDFFEPLPGQAALAAELTQRLGDARDLEDTLDACRRWAHGRQFQAGLHVLLGVTDAQQAATTLTAIAETVLATLVPVALGWVEAQHGAVPGGSFAVLGFGKLGAGELTIGSDLDLVFVFDAPEGARSPGPRGLDAATWFGRAAQRLVSALSARTAEGQLFEIDMRLRPSGNFGPVACSLANFARYQEATAEIWEQQSLCRARAVAGDPALRGRIDAVVATAIRRPREPAAVAAAVRAMRERIFKEHGSEDPWNLKYARGGLVELEFTAQYLVLAHAHELPELHVQATAEVLRRAAEHGLLPDGEVRQLQAALALQQALQMVLRLSGDARFAPDRAPAGLKEALVRAAAQTQPDIPPPAGFAQLEQRLVASQEQARQVFEALGGTEAAA